LLYELDFYQVLPATLRQDPDVICVGEIRDSKTAKSYFHLSDTGFGFLTVFYYYPYTPMQLFVGAIIDYYDPLLIIVFLVPLQ